MVPFYQPHDLVVQVKKRNALGGLDGLSGTEELNETAWQNLADNSLINFIKPGLPPFLQIHGNADTTVPYAQSAIFEAKMKAAGNSCEKITIPGGGHGMGGWAKLNSNDAVQMIAWLKQTLN